MERQVTATGWRTFGQVFSGPAHAVYVWVSPWLLLVVAHVEFLLAIFLLFALGGLTTFAAAVCPISRQIWIAFFHHWSAKR